MAEGWPRECVECGGSGESYPDWLCDTCFGSGLMFEADYNSLLAYKRRNEEARVKRLEK